MCYKSTSMNVTLYAHCISIKKIFVKESKLKFSPINNAIIFGVIKNKPRSILHNFIFFIYTNSQQLDGNHRIT